MPGDALTAGVKNGGLNSRTEIRILLCYLIKTAAPTTIQQLEEALLGEELVNYFEMTAALADLETNGLVEVENDAYIITHKGSVIADTLAEDLPRTVRETAIRGVIRSQIWMKKSAQNLAKVVKTESGYQVECSIADMGQEVFSLTLAMPDELTANAVRKRFVEDGANIYALLLNQLTEPREES